MLVAPSDSGSLGLGMGTGGAGAGISSPFPLLLSFFFLLVVSLALLEEVEELLEEDELGLCFFPLFGLVVVALSSSVAPEVPGWLFAASELIGTATFFSFLDRFAAGAFPLELLLLSLLDELEEPLEELLDELLEELDLSALSFALCLFIWRLILRLCRASSSSTSLPTNVGSGGGSSNWRGNTGFPSILRRVAERLGRDKYTCCRLHS